VRSAAMNTQTGGDIPTASAPAVQPVARAAETATGTFVSYRLPPRVPGGRRAPA